MSVTWTRPPAGPLGTWCLMRDRRGRLHVAGEAVAVEFAEDGPVLERGPYDAMMDKARQHNAIVALEAKTKAREVAG